MRTRLATTVLLLAMATGISFATEKADNPHVLGSCAVVKATNIGQDTQVELRIRIVNPGVRAVSVEKLTLLAPAPVPAKALSAPVLLSPHGEQEISHEFRLPTRLYQSWQKGVRGFLIVGIRRDDGIRFHHMIRLNEKTPLRGE